MPLLIIFFDSYAIDCRHGHSHIELPSAFAAFAMPLAVRRPRRFITILIYVFFRRPRRATHGRRERTPFFRLRAACPLSVFFA